MTDRVVDGLVLVALVLGVAWASQVWGVTGLLGAGALACLLLAVALRQPEAPPAPVVEPEPETLWTF